MPITFEAFLRARRFSTNPFATTNAEQERELLSSYFVRASWFDRLVGTPKEPESLILFAPRGYGKTSHRIEVGRLASERRDGPALIVAFTDFDLLSLDGPSQLGITSYIQTLRRLTLHALDDLLQQRPERLRLLHQQPDMFLRFCALCQLYAPLRARHWREMLPAITTLVDIYRSADLSAREWLLELSELAQAAGCASIYVLIDGVDELTVTQRSLDAALNIIRPPLDSPGLLQGCGFSFKFFLPDFLEAPMRDQQVGRLDRIPIYRLAWTDAALVDMLSRRLIRHSLVNETSQFGYVTSFRDLCEGAVPADIHWVKAAGSSPRLLIDLARQIIEEHCQRTDDVYEAIRVDTFQAVLYNNGSAAISWAAVTPMREVSVAGMVAPPEPPLSRPMPQPHGPRPSQPSAPRPVTNATAQPPELFLDLRGDLWLGDVQCNAKPLPKLLLKCIRFLWNNRNLLVTYDQMMHELYSDTLEERENPRSSCDKVVQRLRKVIEPGKPASRTYIDVRPGTGYVLRNVRSDPEPDNV